MKYLTSRAIVLSRINYGEADRILTVLTPDFGKLRLIAKGVRKSKSKLAGGVELFSVSQLTFIRGRSDIGTLMSSRLESHYGSIAQNLENAQLGYGLLKLTDKNTEDHAEPGYFELLNASLAALNSANPPQELVELYFKANLLNLAGHKPNLVTDVAGAPLEAGQKYGFDASAASFSPSSNGQYDTDIIKFLRLVFSGNSVAALARVSGATALAAASQSLVTAMFQYYLRAVT